MVTSIVGNRGTRMGLRVAQILPSNCPVGLTGPDYDEVDAIE